MEYLETFFAVFEFSSNKLVAFQYYYNILSEKTMLCNEFIWR